CFCPENSVLRSLIDHVMLERDEAVLVDMEAGLEQFGRSTCRGVDLLMVIVEPGARSVDTAGRIVALAGEMGIGRTAIVANGVRDEKDETAVRRLLSAHSLELTHALPYSHAVALADLEGRSLFEGCSSDDWTRAVRELSDRILKMMAE
ncbi:MAG: carbon monoxide dehydrogenase, partial [Thermoplasmata archaeon]